MTIHTILGPGPTSEQELEDYLSTPTEDTVEAVTMLCGDLLILGAGGKMGPSLAALAKRSLDAAGLPQRVICVSRFSDPDVRRRLEATQVDTISVDLLDAGALAALPAAPNVIYLAGMKFGASSEPALTWALNCLLPAVTAERFRTSRIVALSTGNVYPLVSRRTGGATEETPPDPIGEYAQSCLGRERMLEYMSQRHEIPTTLIRLNYATDLRYGVLTDIAQAVYHQRPVDVSVPWLNVIWQRDANAFILRSFELAKVGCDILNVTGADVLSTREVATTFSERFEGTAPSFIGRPSKAALLSNAQRCHDLFGQPRVSTDTLISWVGDWVAAGRRTLGKPTHFAARDGRF